VRRRGEKKRGAVFIYSHIWIWWLQELLEKSLDKARVIVHRSMVSSLDIFEKKRKERISLSSSHQSASFTTPTTTAAAFLQQQEQQQQHKFQQQQQQQQPRPQPFSSLSAPNTPDSILMQLAASSGHSQRHQNFQLAQKIMLAAAAAAAVGGSGNTMIKSEISAAAAASNNPTIIRNNQISKIERGRNETKTAVVSAASEGRVGGGRRGAQSDGAYTNKPVSPITESPSMMMMMMMHEEGGEGRNRSTSKRQQQSHHQQQQHFPSFSSSLPYLSSPSVAKMPPPPLLQICRTVIITTWLPLRSNWRNFWWRI